MGMPAISDPRNCFANDLGLAVGLIEKLSDDLVWSGGMLTRHGGKLQYLDIALQVLGVLRSN